MNRFIVATLFLSTLSFADVTRPSNDVKVGRSAQPVRVESVLTQTVGEHGFPSTQVKVTATFSNACRVPRTKELVQIVNYSRNYDELIISLGSESMRMCPAVYMPVTVTIDLGVFTRPNDGHFRKITVNGKGN